MKKSIFGFLILIAPMVLATPSCAETTINGLILDVEGQVVNYGSDDNVVTMRIGDPFNCAWANNLKAEYFTLDNNDFATKEITKIDRKGDREIQLTFSTKKDAASSLKTPSVQSAVAVSSNAFKKAKVNNAFGSIIVNRAGVYGDGAPVIYGEKKYYVCSFLGAKPFQMAEWSSAEIPLNSFTGEDKDQFQTGSKIVIASDSVENKFYYGFDDMKLIDSPTKSSTTLTLTSDKYQQVIEKETGYSRSLEFKFRVIGGTLIPADMWFGNQYFA